MRHIVHNYKHHFKGKCLDLGSIPETFALLPLGSEGINIEPAAEGILKWDLNTCKIPFPDNEFDFILFSHTIEHLDAPSLLLRECHRVLKPGGRMIIAVPRMVYWNPSNYLNHPRGHKYFWNGKTFRHFLKMHNFAPKKEWVNYPLGNRLMYILWNCTPFMAFAKDMHVLCEVQK